MDATLLANNAQYCCVRCMEPQQCLHLLALVAYSLKKIKLLSPCDANGRNIVGLNMLRPFAWNHNNVGTCWHLLLVSLMALVTC